MYIFAQATSILSDAWFDERRPEAALSFCGGCSAPRRDSTAAANFELRFCVIIPAANSSDQMIRPTQMLRKLSFVFLLFALAGPSLAAQTATTEAQSSQKQSSSSPSAQPLAENKQGVVQSAYLTPISGYQ